MKRCRRRRSCFLQIGLLLAPVSSTLLRGNNSGGDRPFETIDHQTIKESNDQIRRAPTEEVIDINEQGDTTKIVEYNNFHTEPDEDEETDKDEGRVDVNKHEWRTPVPPHSLLTPLSNHIQSIDQYHRYERSMESLLQSQTRIIGGRDATFNEHSYSVAIEDKYGRVFCGGTLIAVDAVLTAAHCTDKIRSESEAVGKGPLRVVIGRSKLSNEEEGEVITVRRELIHPRYDTADITNFDFDFAVLMLHRSTLGTKASIVKLNSNPNWPTGGAPVEVVGWGVTSDSQNVRQPADTLQVARLKVIPNEQCNAVSGRFGEYHVSFVGHIKQTMMCANNRKRDSCQGDSGGPLMMNEIQVGITSWGVGCNQRIFPGVYSRVSAAYTWIERRVCRFSAWPGENFDCEPF